MKKCIQDIFISEKVEDHYDPIYINKTIKIHDYTYTL